MSPRQKNGGELQNVTPGELQFEESNGVLVLSELLSRLRCSFYSTRGHSNVVEVGKRRGNQVQVENGEQLTLSVLDGGQLLLHGLVRGFGEGFGGGTVAVVHQVGGHHPGRRRAESQSHRVRVNAQLPSH